MNILVYDIAAENSGAVTVLKEFYENTKSHKGEDINWIYLLSVIDLEESNNIRVLMFPWIKKSWFHRLYFDYFIAPRIVKKYNIEKVFSLQNTLIPFIKTKQVLYLHQSLPFVKYRFKIHENLRFWIYQNIISEFIKKSIVKSDITIVQTKWMKESCSANRTIDKNKILVIPPHIEIENNGMFNPNCDSEKVFFYPATANSYKNHTLIINACKKLNEMKILNYKVLLTIDGNENKYANKIKSMIKESDVNIELIGHIPRDEVLKLYTKSVLIFPSYVESHPMPLKEAIVSGGIILASNCNFSTEIIGNYPNSIFFDPFDYNDLYDAMKNIIEDKFAYTEVSINDADKANRNNTWSEIIDVIAEL